MVKSSVKNVLIVGYFGYNLIGDEAILEAMLSDLRKLVSNIHFYVTSQAPQETKTTYNVEAIPICNTKVIIDVIPKCDLVIVGGGGIFNEYAKWHGEEFLRLNQDFNVFCASIPILAAIYGKPCMIYAVGVEPLYSPIAREHVGNAFAVASMATVRDSGSRKVLESTPAPIQKIEVTADPCFRLPNARLTALKLLAKHGVKFEGNFIGVQLRHWNPGIQNLKADPNKWENEVAQSLDAFVTSKGMNVVFLPFQQSNLWAFSDDRPVLKRVQNQMRHKQKTYMLKEELKPGEISSIIAGCDLVLAMRFHSVILSVKNTVPCVAIAYSLKVKTAMESSGLGKFALGLDELTVKNLTDILEKCYKERETLRNNLKTVSDKMSRLALRNAEIAVDLLKNNKAVSPLTGRFNEIMPRLLTKQTGLLVNTEAELLEFKHISNIINELIRTLIQESQQYELMEKTLRALLEVNPNNPEWHYLYAFCLHIQKKELEDALKHYNIALEQGFSEFWVRFNRSDLYLYMGKLKEARADIKRALKLNSEHPGIRELNERI